MYLVVFPGDQPFRERVYHNSLFTEDFQIAKQAEIAKGAFVCIMKKPSRICDIESIYNENLNFYEAV